MISNRIDFVLSSDECMFNGCKHLVHLSVRLVFSISEGWQEKCLMAAAQVISLDLVISLSVEQNIPSFLKAQRSQSVCHFGIQLLPKQHIPPPNPFYILFAAPPPRLVLISVMPRKGWSAFDWALEMMLFNTRIRILVLSWIHICKFQGVTSVAVGAICYWGGGFSSINNIRSSRP